ncbi:MAG: serine hydrolase domain-containing protein [Marinoscillum sp.]
MRFIAAIVILPLVLASCKDDQPVHTKQPTNELQELLSETVSDYNIPGLIAAVIDAEGIRLMESAGVRKYGLSDSLSTKDLIHLGSCTKAMTSTLLATLVKSGDLTWDTTLIEVFPELEGDIHEDYYDVTLHQLVTHRAGVPANAQDWWAYQDLEITQRRIALIKANLASPSEIGIDEYQYSNLGYMIAGSMAEKVTGLSWEQLMQEKVFEPLGMTSAGFGAPGTPDQTDQPWGHSKSAGQWQALQADNAQALGPAGTVHSTFEDWAKFIRLQLPQHSPEILNRAQLDELIDPIGEYASGWIVGERSWANGTTLNHSGSNTIWYVVVWVAPELNRAFMVGTNSFDNRTFQMADGIIGELIQMDQEL